MRKNHSAWLLSGIAALALASTGCANVVANLPDAQARAEMRADQRRQDLLERERARRRARDETPTEVRSVEDLVREGDRFREEGRDSKAYVSYLRAHFADRDEVEPMRRIAFLTLRKDSVQAQAIFEQLAADQPGDSLVFLGLGIARLAGDDLAGARAALVRALEIEPGLAQASATLGVVYDRMQFHREAQRHYRLALDARPGDTLLLNNLGVSHMLARENEQAVDVLRSAVARGSTDAALLNNLGMALASLRRYDDALDVFRSAGSEGDACNNLGYAAFLNGDYELAGRLYERALLANDTDEERVLHNLSLLERARSE